jgi:hypothetical protein
MDDDVRRSAGPRWSGTDWTTTTPQDGRSGGSTGAGAATLRLPCRWRSDFSEAGREGRPRRSALLLDDRLLGGRLAARRLRRLGRAGARLVAGRRGLAGGRRGLGGTLPGLHRLSSMAPSAIEGRLARSVCDRTVSFPLRCRLRPLHAGALALIQPAACIVPCRRVAGGARTSGPVGEEASRPLPGPDAVSAQVERSWILSGHELG